MTLQTTTFKGARYLVKFHNPIEWADTESYEAIEAVQHNAYTYISKQPVPAGVQIDNTDFWLLWADPNAQMEELRQLVASYVEDVQALDTLVDAVNDALPIADFDNVNTVKAALDGIAEVLPLADFTDVNTVKKYIDDAVSEIQTGLGDIENYGLDYEYGESENYLYGIITFPKSRYGLKVALNSGSNDQQETLENYALREKPFFCFNCSNSSSFIYNGILSGGSYTPPAEQAGFYIFDDDNTDLVRIEQSDGTTSWQTIFNQGVKNAVAGWQNLIENGTPIDIADYETFTTRNPYPVIAWDDENYYFMQIIGRKFSKPGITFAEIRSFAESKQWPNCGVLDGGDSQRAFFGNPIIPFSTKYNRYDTDRTAYVNITVYEKEV